MEEFVNRKKEREKAVVLNSLQHLYKSSGMKMPEGIELELPRMPGEKLKPEHMLYDIHLIPENSASKAKGAVSLSSRLSKNGYMPHVALEMNYHGTSMLWHLSEREARNMVGFTNVVRGRDVAPVFYADPEDPLIKSMLESGSLKFKETEHGRTAEFRLPNSAFDNIATKLFNKYIKSRVEWMLIAKTSARPVEERDFGEKKTAHNKRHESIAKQIITCVMQAARDTRSLALVDPKLLTKREKALVSQVVGLTMSRTDADYRKTMIKSVVVSLRRNLSSGSENPKESASKLASFLNSGPEFKSLQREHLAHRFTPAEILDIVDRMKVAEARKRAGN